MNKKEMDRAINSAIAKCGISDSVNQAIFIAGWTAAKVEAANMLERASQPAQALGVMLMKIPGSQP